MRLRTYRFSEIGNNNYYYDDYENEFYTRKITEKCYIPANKIILDLIHKFQKKLKVSYLFSGVVLDQFELYAPEAIESFKSLISTGCVKLLSGSYSNSFGLPAWNREFNKQVTLQKTRIRYLFRKNPLVFPEKDVFNSNPTDPAVRIYIGNHKSYDSISIGFSCNKNHGESLTAGRLLQFLNADHNKDNDTAVLFIPYEISGDYQNTGLNEFLESLPAAIFSKSDYSFADPSEISIDFHSELQTGYTSSNTYENFELSGNPFSDLQKDAFEKLFSLRDKVELCNDRVINKDWLYLQSRDHFYFMDPELYEENKSSSLIVPYNSPYFAYLNYMNILDDLSVRLNRWIINEIKPKKISMQKWNNALKKSAVREMLK